MENNLTGMYTIINTHDMFNHSLFIDLREEEGAYGKGLGMILIVGDDMNKSIHSSFEGWESLTQCLY